MIRCLPVRKIAFVILLALAVSVAGCRSCQKTGPNERLRVIVSIFPIYDLVRRVAGPDADVTLLLQPGHNEHHFDPTPKDVELAAQAKLGVMVGLGLDPWMEKLLHDAAPTARVLKLGDRVPTLTIKDDPIGADDHEDEDHDHDDHDHEKGAPDPHCWLDPQRAQLMVRAIAEELGKADSAHTLAYRQRATELDKSLVDVDREAEERLKKLSKKGFVTFHGSFGYFAERYKLNILAVIEPFPGSQPTGEYVAKVLAAIKDKKVPALYSEPQLDPRPAKVLADEAKIPLGVLDPVGGGPETDSYEKMIRFDVASLEKYLK
jgi:zinc transport system substrate-binding protein